KRLAEAADRGQFARAQEIQVLFTLAAVLGALGMVGRPAVDRVTAYAVSIFTRFPAITVRSDTVPSLLQEIMLLVGPIVIPILVACCVAALLAGGLQSGFQVASKALEFNWERLNPMEGMKRVFDQGSFVRTGIDVLKIIAVGGTLWLGARKLLQDPLFTAPIEAVYLGTFLNQAVTIFFGRLLGALGVLAALRYSYEKYKLRREM